MRKTGLCGVVIATLFGAAGLLQHPSHQSSQNKQQESMSSLAAAGVNLLNSTNMNGRDAAGTLPDGFLRVIVNAGPTPAELAEARRVAAARQAQIVQEQVAQQQAEEAAQAQAAAAAAVQAQAEQRQQEAEAAAAAAQQRAAEEAQAQAAAAARARAAQQTQSVPGGVWAELRDCESGGDWAADTGNGYYGAYQFALATWQGLGFSGLPSEASPAVQTQAAEELQARSGWDQWPACAAELGL
ncbi:MAG: transglycosylase family protein [Acidimicrobiales bacterium]|jgi:membrane protein involved in colicin uptake